MNEAIREQLDGGTIFSATHPIEIEVAEMIVDTIPCAEKLRFLKTGSSATTAAVRIARAYTDREIIIKGGYHGWHDWCIANTKRNAGIPKTLSATVFEARYNNIESYEELFEKYPKKIAAVILEPVEFEEPKDNFLKKLKKLTNDNEALLIFDEIVSGFRTALGGAQDYYKVTPDMATFGKSIANGMPLSVVTGKAEIFDKVSDKIFISSTFGGEVLSLAAAKATMIELKEKPVIKSIWSIGDEIKKETNKIKIQLSSSHYLFKKQQEEEYLLVVGLYFLHLVIQNKM